MSARSGTPGRWASSRRRELLPPGWTALRKEVFLAHGDVCHVCGGHGARTVDHVNDVATDHRPENLRPIHEVPCHRDKTERAAAEARRRLGRKRPDPEPHPGLLRP